MHPHRRLHAVAGVGQVVLGEALHHGAQVGPGGRGDVDDWAGLANPLAAIEM